jgi:hypothetical protein
MEQIASSVAHTLEERIAVLEAWTASNQPLSSPSASSASSSEVQSLLYLLDPKVTLEMARIAQELTPAVEALEGQVSRGSSGCREQLDRCTDLLRRYNSLMESQILQALAHQPPSNR